MTPTDRVDLTTAELDTVAWRFLRSEFAGRIYSDWSLDRRLDAYLLRHGGTDFLVDGSAYAALLERVMVNIGPARRNGVLSLPDW
ncbi:MULTISPECIES: hypothetical protein [unclassified Mycobacterium]|uniref:hypothetical protein n=1 Tax=unclassified Mycobacterium TaxID=2642494 RepID=UPI0007FE6FB9|nr:MULTISPECIES: hypothetical protein [unclassified Mycobacterium]OBB37337.1 hypothetical protein A5752_15020 [Mycobacterium sp. 852002-51961_SCH5331710]OBH01799.1 hypothetical protein A5698_07435 [Mycobacterium sp. E136]